MSEERSIADEVQDFLDAGGEPASMTVEIIGVNRPVEKMEELQREYIARIAQSFQVPRDVWKRGKDE